MPDGLTLDLPLSVLALLVPFHFLLSLEPVGQIPPRGQNTCQDFGCDLIESVGP